MTISPTIASIRIRAAETVREIEDMMKYDLPQDPIIRALCDRLIVAMENEAEVYDTCPYCGVKV